MHNVVLIGCGLIAGYDITKRENTHACAINKESRLNLIACVDNEYEKAICFSKIFKCQPYDNYQKALIEHRPSVVSICTPDSTHYEICKSLMMSKFSPKIIFVEKPICTSKDQLFKLNDLAKKSKTHIFVNHSRRFSPKYKQIRNIIKSNKLGECIKIDATYYGGWIHNGTHMIDLIIYLLDDYPVFNYLINILPCSAKFDPTIQIIGSMHQSNAELIISAIDEKFYQIFELDLFFTRGRIKMTNFDQDFNLFVKIINQLGENILKTEQINFSTDSELEIFNAYKLIANYLDNGKSEDLDFVSLEAANATMNVIWQGVELCQ